LFVIKNLKEKQLLSSSLLRYFVQVSLAYKEYDLFYSILDIYKPTLLEKLKWQILYVTLPMQLVAYRIKKEYIKEIR
jgi:hypothetical protein